MSTELRTAAFHGHPLHKYWDAQVFCEGRILGLIMELLWTLPAAGLMILIRKKFAQLKDSAWAGPIGALVGALYAVALNFLVGPSIQAVDVPFLPLTMTVGTAVGAVTLSSSLLKNRCSSMPWLYI